MQWNNDSRRFGQFRCKTTEITFITFNLYQSQIVLLLLLMLLLLLRVWCKV